MTIWPQFMGELRREFLVWRSYRVNAISSLLMWGVIFPILLVTVQSVVNANTAVGFGERERAESLIGFLVWNLCMGVLRAIPLMVAEESRTGTLENVLTSTYLPFGTLFALRILARSLRSILETALLGLVLVLFFRLPLIPSFTAVLVALLTLAGTCGVGMALAGLAMIYKSVSSVTGLVANLAFLISGALVPINALGLVFTALKLFFPTTWGIDVLRGVVLNGDSLAVLLRGGALPGLLLQTGLMLAIGWLVFNISLQRARTNGVLGVY